MIKKKAQEEIMGFALIMIIVAVILLILLGFSLRNTQKHTIESYEIRNFIQASLQYTSDCRDNNDLEYLSIQDLISDCDKRFNCLDERDTCKVLNSTLTGILKESWKVEGDRPVKGYELNITLDGTEIIPTLEKGNTIFVD